MRSNKTSPYYKKTPINSVVDAHNRCIKELNGALEKANVTLINKRREILLKQDKAANDALLQIVDEFNKNSEDIRDYITRSHECLDKTDIAGSTYCINRIKELLNEEACLIHAIEDLQVEDAFKDAFAQTPIIHAKNDTPNSFFEGCVTKEEYDARYKHLVKAFHPDNMGGDKAMFERLQTEYEQYRKHYQ